MPTTVLVTGGAGFIGSHTCVELLTHGYDVVVVDDHSNSSPHALERVAKTAGRPVTAAYETDLRDRRALNAVFDAHRVDAVIHFAAKKAVGESVQIPVAYYDTNVGGTTALLAAMEQHDVRRLVFSSSCSLYGDATKVPLTETDPVAPTNPYATSKLLCERIIGDVCRRLPGLSVLALRYFNPVGAHPSGHLGEDPRGVPNNVMPYLAQVAVGRRARLRVFGDDYPTFDGTGVRDYIHVMDVAEGHRVALEHLDDEHGMRVFNLGTGTGTSVLELLAAFSAACGREIPHEITGRRPGDVPALIADPGAVARAWGWTTRRDLADMCRDAWRFQELNPSGYPD
ncbi:MULTISPECIES: UDP-glucose 4-epimerase GalE [unclassified Streptomyces]|uniref:UDP-glucose 4-epimerase GalE n=1 Tax=unclassified Streptomyces TaxID=2593676 RepID=UPI0022B74F78|nr:MULTISPECIES: UDP-glucose 4-epimerase GalE [unclassified Streptomyces]MCZ7417235.1 UDP-glucose 4-epimerase GalE [Streptomyces sp. WMMC897]MCZ7432937.1 UDP-glucose 4-epimerase GalE [Streptomyces sp. WMMC1477]